jgi:hypothetical protein
VHRPAEHPVALVRVAAVDRPVVVAVLADRSAKPRVVVVAM